MHALPLNGALFSLALIPVHLAYINESIGVATKRLGHNVLVGQMVGCFAGQGT